MYAGALLWIVSVGIVLSLALSTYTYPLIRSNYDGDGKRPLQTQVVEARVNDGDQFHAHNFLKKMGFTEDVFSNIGLIISYMIFPLIGQWLFWAGFLRMAGDL